MESKLTKKPAATITANGKQLELPVYGGSVGPDVIDIRKLYAETERLHLRSGLHLHSLVREPDHLHRWR
jgi:hypothetical protein